MERVEVQIGAVPIMGLVISDKKKQQLSLILALAIRNQQPRQILKNKSRQILPKTHPKGVHSRLDESETPVLQSLPPYFMVFVGGIPVHQDYLRFWRAKDVHLTASIPALCWLNSSELVVVLQNISSATRCNQGTRKF